MNATPLDNYYESQILSASCKLDHHEANKLVRSICGNKYEDATLSVRLRLERMMRKGADIEMDILRFLPVGSWLGYLVQSVLFDLRGK